MGILATLLSWMDDQELEAAIRRHVEMELAVRKAIDAQETRRSGALAELLKHPFTLLLAGAALTTIIGPRLATHWQLQQWRIQQYDSRSADEGKEMRALQQETAEAVAGSCTAADEVLQMVNWNWSSHSAVATLGDRANRWHEARRTWRVSEKVLIVRVRSVFGIYAESALMTIAQKQRILSADIEGILSSLDRKQAIAKAVVSNDRTLIAEIAQPGGSRLTHLMRLMEMQIRDHEAQRTENEPKLPWF
jgi:hypothetical protein